jgi:hypothetical protein
MRIHNWKKKEFVKYWKYYREPSRPSKSELEFIEEKIKEKGHSVNVLILGSTPEYREICGRLGIGVTCLDFSRFNYDWIGKEVKHKPVERFIEGNWLTAKTKDKFDIILGDNVIQVVRKEDTESLLRNISTMLKKEGYFMPRSFVRDKDEDYTGESAIKEYREKWSNEGLYRGTVRNLFVSLVDKKTDSFMFRDGWRLIEKLHHDKIITDKEFEEYKNFSFDRDFYVYIPIREDLDRIFLGFFKIKEIFYGKEKFLKDKLPLHVLTLR